MLCYLAGLALILQSTSPDLGWSTTQHTIQLASKPLSYTATAGFVPLIGEDGSVQAKLFFTAYNLADARNRPVTFVWNGGPGGSSMLLHMFCMGPKRMEPVSSDPKLGFQLLDNQNTMLPTTDLVFMDPVGTGYSKAENADQKIYWGIDGDIKATRQFIHKYLELTHRLKSDVFLAGESYGTFRAAGVAYPLLYDQVNLRGIIFLSSALHYDTFVNLPGNELPYDVFVPTYTATAAFHKKLHPEWNDHPDLAIAEARKFAGNDLLVALAKGDSLPSKERHRIATRLSELTSLPVEYIEKVDLRIDPDAFRAELLRKEGKRLDKNLGNVIGTYNPTPPEAVSCFSAYVKGDLGLNTSSPYVGLNMTANLSWKYGSAVEGFPDQTSRLRSAILKDPGLKLFVGQGLYDLTTPFYGAEYSFLHLGLPQNLRGNLQFHTYEGGHMMYLSPAAHEKLHQEMSSFERACLLGGSSAN